MGNPDLLTRGSFCTARDYGIHQISINGKDAGERIDFYSVNIKWVRKSLGVYDLPASAQALPEALRNERELPAGARMGSNDWKRAAWGGRCPPVGRHRYVFTLYALDALLGERGALTRAELEDALAGHVHAKAELVGTYARLR